MTKKKISIIGAGPSGSSAASILAKEGFDVHVFEKEELGRYCVGESLIPFCYFPLKKLGLLAEMEKLGFTKKYSVQFARQDGKISQPFFFETHCKGDEQQTWQVERVEFDKILIKNAEQNGAQFHFKSCVDDLIFEGDRAVGLILKSGEKVFHDYLIDASGRNTFVARKNNWKVYDPNLQKMAIWNYFKGAKRDEGKNSGATTVASLSDSSWFWYIPLKNDIVSVGIVGDKKDLFQFSKNLETVFNDSIEKNLWIKDHLEGSTSTMSYQVIGEFTYRSKHSGTNGILLTGDSFSFIDPVFSSGVLLALESGIASGETVSRILNGEDEKLLQEEYSQKIIFLIENMRRLVYAFYDKKFSFKSLFMKYSNLQYDLTDCLIGNLNRSFDDLFKGLDEFSDPPEKLSIGKPLFL